MGRNLTLPSKSGVVLKVGKQAELIPRKGICVTAHIYTQQCVHLF